MTGIPGSSEAKESTHEGGAGGRKAREDEGETTPPGGEGAASGPEEAESYGEGSREGETQRGAICQESYEAWGVS